MLFDAFGVIFVLMLFGVWCLCFFAFWGLFLLSFWVIFVLMFFGVWCLCFATPLLNQVAAQGPSACRLCRFQTNRFLLYSVHCNVMLCNAQYTMHNAQCTMQCNAMLAAYKCRFQTNRFLRYSVHCNAQCTLYIVQGNTQRTMNNAMQYISYNVVSRLFRFLLHDVRCTMHSA